MPCAVGATSLFPAALAPPRGRSWCCHPTCTRHPSLAATPSAATPLTRSERAPGQPARGRPSRLHVARACMGSASGACALPPPPPPARLPWCGRLGVCWLGQTDGALWVVLRGERRAGGRVLTLKRQPRGRTKSRPLCPLAHSPLPPSLAPSHPPSLQDPPKVGPVVGLEGDRAGQDVVREWLVGRGRRAPGAEARLWRAAGSRAPPAPAAACLGCRPGRARGGLASPHSQRPPRRGRGPTIKSEFDRTGRRARRCETSACWWASLACSTVATARSVTATRRRTLTRTRRGCRCWGGTWRR